MRIRIAVAAVALPVMAGAAAAEHGGPLPHDVHVVKVVGVVMLDLEVSFSSADGTDLPGPLETTFDNSRTTINDEGLPADKTKTMPKTP